MILCFKLNSKIPIAYEGLVIHYVPHVFYDDRLVE